MTSKTSLLTAFVLGSATLGLQLPWSVPQDAIPANVLAVKIEQKETATPEPTIEEITESEEPSLHAAARVHFPIRVVTAPAPIVLPPPPVHDPLKAVEQDDILPRHRALARKVLELLPVECQEKLEEFYVVYNDPSHRGLAGKGVIIMNGSIPDNDFAALLMHEGLGHFWDLTCINGSADSGESTFRDGNNPVYLNDPSALFYAISWKSVTERKPTARKRDFASGYAYAADPFEDLAETVVYYMLQEEAFKARAKANSAMAKKLKWMQTYLPKSKPVAKGTAWNGTIAWNAAKIPFTWITSVGQRF